MEYVDGVNLRQAMQAGRFTPQQALAVVPQVCEALQYAHQEGVLHRDIKPENILLDSRGKVKIADFGIAKLVGELHAEDARTLTGARLGTPHYMAPEQIEHPGDVDHRADIYSLGVVFYEMLTGELPLGRFAPPSEKSSSDPRLDDVVFRTLAKEPSRRPQSAGDVKTQVESASTGPAVPPPQPQGPTPSPVSCYLSSPEHLARWYGKVYIYEESGLLSLDHETLCFTYGNQSIPIPLSSITEVSVGQYPWFAKPTGLDFIAVTFPIKGVMRQVLLTPNEGGFRSTTHTNYVVAVWVDHLRKAIKAATGRTPPSRPAKEFRSASSFKSLYVILATVLLPLTILLWSMIRSFNFGRISPAMIMVFVFVAYFVMVLFLILRGSRNRSSLAATPAEPSAKVRWPPYYTVILVVLVQSVITFGFLFYFRRPAAVQPEAPRPIPTDSSAPSITKIIELTGVTNTDRSLRIDTHSVLQPGESINASLRHPDGRVEPGIVSTIIRRGPSTTARTTVFNWNLPESIPPERVAGIGDQMRQILTDRPIGLVVSIPQEVFAVTNRSGGIFKGFLTFGRVVPVQDSGTPTATVRFGSVAEIPRSLIFHYDLSVPAGFLVLAGGISNDRSVAETTTCSGRSLTELGNNCIWSFPEGFGAQEIHAAALALTQSGGRGPIKVLQGAPSSAFSVTNAAHEVFTGYFELLGGTNTFPM